MIKLYEILKKIKPLRKFVIKNKLLLRGKKLRKKGIFITLSISRLILSEQWLISLAYGSLLGIYRDGKFIKHDSDLDLFLLTSYRTIDNVKLEIIRSKMSDLTKLSKKSILIINEHNKLKFKLSGIEVDLHICSKLRNREYFAFKHKIIIKVNENIANDELIFPSNTEEILLQLYGEEWRVPDTIPYQFRGGFPFND
jgi:phosphorylcholine metabolism protein LicD